MPNVFKKAQFDRPRCPAKIAAFGFNKRHIPSYIRVAHAAVAFGLQFSNLEKQRSKPAKRHADEQHPPF